MEGLRTWQRMEDACGKVLNGQIVEQRYLEEVLRSAVQKDR